MKASNSKPDARSPHSPRCSRRDFLKTGGAGLAAITAFGSGALAQRAPAGETEIVFAIGPDESGTMARLIEDFNAAYKGRISARWLVMARESDVYYDQLRSGLNAGATDIDVIGGDVVWTPQLAHNDWVLDLSGRFHRDFSAASFFEPALQSVGYGMRVWAVPFYTDAGMLFYRKDLLEKAGYSEPPADYEAMMEMVAKVKSDMSVPHGYVFQGADYEGGTVNCVEHIWGAGGRVLIGNLSFSPHFGVSMTGSVDPSEIQIDSTAATAGFKGARDLVTKGVSPSDVAQFREAESMQVFLDGKAVFLRNWPYVYGRLRNPKQSAIDAGQVGVARIPVWTRRPSQSCLGGWNLFINRYSTKADAAWEFIKFAASPEQQKKRALRGGFLPVSKDLYDVPELVDAMPVIKPGRDIVASARSRPSSPFYSQMSPRISWAFHRVVRGDVTAEDATRRLAQELKNIQRHNR